MQTVTTRVKVPPPKPDTCQLTRLSKYDEDEDYCYEPVFTPEANSAKNGPVKRTGPQSPQYGPVKSSGPQSPQYKSQSSTTSNGSRSNSQGSHTGQSVVPPIKAPRAVQHKDSPDFVKSSNAISDKWVNRSPVNQNSELNNNGDNTSNGKVYEETLLKPSQLRAQKNAEAQRAK